MQSPIVPLYVCPPTVTALSYLPGIWPHPHHTLSYLAPPRFTHVIKTGLSQTLIDPPLSASCWEQRGEGRGDSYKLFTALGGDRWR